MKDINKGRICLLVVIGLGIIIANMIWGEMKDIPILYIYTIPSMLYMPVVGSIGLIGTYIYD